MHRWLYVNDVNRINVLLWIHIDVKLQICFSLDVLVHECFYKFMRFQVFL